MSKHSGQAFCLLKLFLNLCTNSPFSPLMLNLHCYICHMQFANCQSYTKNANINVVPESPCTYWAGRTNALVNCYLQRHAVRKVHPMWNVNAILATHYGKPLITLHGYTVSLLKSRREKGCLLSPRVSKPLLKAPSLLLFLFLSLYQRANVLRWMHQVAKVKIWEKRL